MNDKNNIYTTTVLVAGLLCSSAYAEEQNRIAALHKAHCVACHTQIMNGSPDDIYTRKNRKVNDYEGLFRQVNLCKTNLNLDWSQTKTDEVIDYLNQRYYKFDF